MTQSTCSVRGCPSAVIARRMCTMHYQRFMKYGSADALLIRRKPIGGAPRAAGRRSLCDEQLSMFFPAPALADTTSRRERTLKIRRQRRIEDLDRVRAVEKARVSRAEVKKRNAEHRKKYLATDKGRFKAFLGKAGRRNIEMSLTYEQWVEITKSPCTYCGEHCFNGSANGYGVDRVDSLEGYTLENSVACCGNCNIMKHLLSVDEFVAHVRKVVAYQDLKLSSAA